MTNKKPTLLTGELMRESAKTDEEETPPKYFWKGDVALSGPSRVPSSKLPSGVSRG